MGNNRKYLWIAVSCIAGFVAGFLQGRQETGMTRETCMPDREETKETTVDTIPYHMPVPKSESVSGTRRYTLPACRSLGGDNAGEPRQRRDNDSPGADTIVTAHHGTGAGGEPRCREDSAVVELPIIRRHYADSTYEAWVSGPVDPRLDSLRVFAPTTTVTKREWKPSKRWHIGVTAGYGYGTKGLSPYIGVGLTYSIFSF